MHFLGSTRFRLTVVALLLVAATRAEAESATWRRGEIEGGSVRALTRDPASGRIYAAGGQGLVFASDDDGVSWRRVNQVPLSRFGLVDLEVASGALIAIQDSNRELLRSTDGGATWAVVPVNFGVERRAVVVRDVTVPSRLYLTASSLGVLRSDDSGATWSSLSKDLLGLPPSVPRINGFAQSPVRPQLLYATAGTSGIFGVFRSEDGGTSWTFLGHPGGRPLHIVAHPSDGDVVFVLTSGGVRRSRDRGESWQGLDPGIDQTRFDRFGFSPSGALLLGIADGVGMLRSADDGETFSTVSLASNPVMLWDLLAVGDSPRMLAATLSGILASSDDGLTWAPADRGLSGVLPNEMVVAAGEGTRLYVVHDGGFARSDDRGATWTRLELGAAGTFPFQLVASAQSAATVYAAIHPLVAARLAASTDAGRTWTLPPPPRAGPPYHEITAIAVDRLDDQHLVVGFFDGVLLASTDGGTSWEQIFEASISPSHSIVVVGDLIVVGYREARPASGIDDGVVIRSEDGGATWTEVFRLPRMQSNRRLIVTIDPVDAQLLYLSTLNDAHRSLDGGRTWQALESLPAPSALDIATDSARGDIVLVSSSSAGIYRSDDRGDTWVLLPPPPEGETFLRVASAADGTIHAGTATGLYTLVPDDVACEGPHRLCLAGERFLVEVAWKDFQGGSGSGVARTLTSDTGAFWFFDPGNVELVVKVLDARAVNGHFWVFYGSLTNVEFRLRVTDRVSGEVVDYVNPSEQFASRGDTGAFAAAGAAGVAANGGATAGSPVRRGRSGMPTAAAGICTADATSLCLAEGRFRVQVEWQDFQGGAGAGRAAPIPGSSDTGTFWFFDPANVELVVKVLDARAVDGHFWVFYGALTNVGYTLTVTDSESGESVVYENPAGTFGSHGDTAAFPG
jgi:photosystem II stability/assembly factor-like uncharacterized protein